MRRNHGFIGWVCVLIAAGLSACGPDTPPEVILPDDNGNDTIIVHVSSEMPPVRISDDNPFTREGIDLGRHLFYEPMLSRDNSQSCGSCHEQILGFTDHGNKVSKGIVGVLGTRNAMTIFNLMWHDNFFWDSRAVNMRQQVLMPIQNPVEMDATLTDVIAKLNESAYYKDKFKKAFGIDVIDTTHLAMALEQFLFSMVSDNSRFDKFNRGEIQLTPAELRGFERLKIKGCFNCHKGSLFLDNKSHNTGLDRFPPDKGLYEFTGLQSDVGKFKTPSLRNVMVTAPYMHDGRFETIEEVLDFYDGEIEFDSPNVDRELLQIGTRAKLQPQDVEDIKAFLRTLTDTDFINDQKLSDPF